MPTNVKHFPSVILHLEKEEKDIRKLIGQEAYGEALERIEALFAYQYKLETFQELYLQSLAGLGRWKEVEERAEALLSKSSKQQGSRMLYYYALSLFEQEEYFLLVDYFDKEWELDPLAGEEREALNHLYKAARKQLDEVIHTRLKELQVAILSRNEGKQWQLVQSVLRFQYLAVESLVWLLQEKEVNPFVKTVILQYMQERGLDQEITIVKPQGVLTCSVKDIPVMEASPVYRATLKSLDELEQANPTLHAFTVELLTHYLEYRFPFFYEPLDVELVAKAASLLAKKHLEATDCLDEAQGPKIKHFLEEIQYSNELYFRLNLI